jgi:hypothetical protein
MKKRIFTLLLWPWPVASVRHWLGAASPISSTPTEANRVASGKHRVMIFCRAPRSPQLIPSSTGLTFLGGSLGGSAFQDWPSRIMRIQSKTLLVFASPLLLAVAAAYFQWAVFGLPAIPPGAQPPAAGQPQGFPGWLRITHYVNFLLLTLLIRSGSHPLTLLADEMNYAPLGGLHGAPLRLRVENQLGFKMVKWIKAIEFVSSIRQVGEGEGGYNEDHEYFGELANI